MISALTKRSLKSQYYPTLAYGAIVYLGGDLKAVNARVVPVGITNDSPPETSRESVQSAEEMYLPRDSEDSLASRWIPIVGRETC